LYQYHGTLVHEKRLSDGICRCQSTGVVFNAKDLIRNGLIFEPLAFAYPLNTPRIKTLSNPDLIIEGNAKPFIYAVSLELDLHVAPDGNRPTDNSVKHETLFHNEHVLAAGEIWIRDGIIAGMNDYSGSYGTRGEMETNPAFAKAVLSALIKQNLPVNEHFIMELNNLSIP
jgi:hypothetical protein